jgi:hypothetical protein
MGSIVPALLAGSAESTSSGMLPRTALASSSATSGRILISRAATLRQAASEVNSPFLSALQDGQVIANCRRLSDSLVDHRVKRGDLSNELSSGRPLIIRGIRSGKSQRSSKPIGDFA